MPATDPSSFATDADLLLQYPVFADTQWQVIVRDDSDDTYTVTVAGVDYSFVAVGETIESIRDGLLAALVAGVGFFSSTPVNTNAIDLVSSVPGFSLAVETSPASLAAVVGPPGFTPELRTCYLELTKCYFDEEIWGCCLFQGHTAATAHMLKLWSSSKGTSGATPTGQTTSMTQGPYSQSWSTTSNTTTGSDGWWGLTPEGMSYIALRDSLGSVAFSPASGMDCRHDYRNC